MNSTKKSELKQSVIAALSTFPCPVTVPEILHKLAPDDRSLLTRPELTELLEEMILEGEAEKFPVNRYACHHIWDSTNKERRCSRCHRLEPIKPTEEEAMNTDIEVLTDSETITSELLDEEEEQDRQEAIALKAEIIKLMADFFVALGEKLKYYQENKFYRFEADNFGTWCEQELGIQRAHAYRLIRAYEVYHCIQSQCRPMGDKKENDYQNISQPNIPLPTSERQLRPLTKLPEDQWFPTWCEAVERNGRNDKAPAGKIVEQVVKEKKAMETAHRYQSEVERFNQGEIVRITAKHNPDLKEYHHHWAIIERVEEFGYALKTYKGDVTGVLHDDLMLIKQASVTTTEVLLDKMKKSLAQYNQDPGCVAFLHHLATKPIPDVSAWENDVLNFSANLR